MARKLLTVLALLVILTACAPTSVESTTLASEEAKWVPEGHTVAVIEDYDPNEYYRVVSSSDAKALEYQYLPCESEGCVPNSVRYGVEDYGGCLAVESKDSSTKMVDLDDCGPFFDGSLPVTAEANQTSDPEYVPEGNRLMDIKSTGGNGWVLLSDMTQSAKEQAYAYSKGSVTIGGREYRLVYPISDPSWIGTIDMGDQLIPTPRLSTQDLKGLEITIPRSAVGDDKPDAQVGIWSVEVWTNDVVAFNAPDEFDSYGWGFGSWACYETSDGDGFTTQRTYEEGMVTIKTVSCVP